MKTLIISAYPFNAEENYTPQHLKELQKIDPFQQHEITENPEEAELIIFAEHHQQSDPYFFTIYKNKVYKEYKKKCYLYHNDYSSITFIPTISATIRSKYYNEVFNQPFSYLLQLTPNEYTKTSVPTKNRKYLFSFIGRSSTHTVRKKIFAINYEKAFFSDTSGMVAWELLEHERHEYAKRFAEICSESKFILCPRGASPNSYRLYESMEMGIVPVVISDEWVPSLGPKWEEFSIRISEKDVKKIPQILEAYESEFSAMGKLAKEAYVKWFAKDKQFHHLVEACIKLHTTRNKVSFFVLLKQSLQFFKLFHLRGILRYLKNATGKKIRTS